MIDKIINLLKDEENISNSLNLLIIGIFVFAVLKYLSKSSKILSYIFKILFYFIIAILFCIILGNIIATHDYFKLWYLVIVLLVTYFQKYIPQVVKWYDAKIDGIGGKINNSKTNK
ncbi:hypothetical protein [Flavobacterium sp.]|jgi:hypothetical protein|uniref:hypothetical protein n=1 Tax=Flavobacterium sp. TaxID=239 RepID=UPI0037C012B7